MNDRSQREAGSGTGTERDGGLLRNHDHSGFETLCGEPPGSTFHRRTDNANYRDAELAGVKFQMRLDPGACRIPNIRAAVSIARSVTEHWLW